MDTEEQTLEALRQSLEAPVSGVDPSSVQMVNDSASSAASTAVNDFDAFLDFGFAVMSSVASNPLFYLKVAGVLGLTIMIIMISIELVSGG